VKEMGFRSLAVRTEAVVRDVAWRSRPTPVAPLPPSWRLERTELERTRVIWPSQYEWPDADRWLGSLVTGLRAHVPVDLEPLPQTYRHVAVFQLERNGKRHAVAVDYRDSSELDDDCRRSVDLYFKLQFRLAGYGDPLVVPGGFPPSWPRLYSYLGRLRGIRDRRNFTSDVYGRFTGGWAVETRSRAVELLRRQNVFRYRGGFEVVRYNRYLAEVAGAKVCIDLPGIGDLCFRLLDYLAIGSCVIGPRPGARLHAPLTDGENVVYCADDLSDLVDLCEHYVRHDDERERIAGAARAHFDRCLEQTQWAAYYLRTAADALGRAET
jgi:hypothetical protein